MPAAKMRAHHRPPASISRNPAHGCFLFTCRSTFFSRPSHACSVPPSAPKNACMRALAAQLGGRASLTCSKTPRSPFAFRVTCTSPDADASTSKIDSFFQVTQKNSTVKRELVGGATTFASMVYICVVNPAILAAGGIPAGAAFTATCLSAAFGCILMGLLAGLPVALAPGMGINAFIAYTLCQSMAWQTAIGCVAVSGVIFLGISLTPLREKLIEAIPDSLRRGAAAGIGVLLGLVGLKNASIVAANPATIVGEGALGSPPALIAVAGLAVIVALEGRRVAGSVLVAVACCAAGAVALGLHPWEGVFASPPSLAPTLLVADWRAALEPGMLAAILALLWSDFFDTAGTLVGVTRAIPGPDGDIKPAQMRKAMLADAVATLFGACIGTSTVTSFGESAAGVAVGARTGLAACTTGVLFLVALFFYPLTSSVAPFATTPALLFVAASMMKALAGLDWDDVTEWVPAITTVLGIGLCFSIASGVGIGAIVYVIGKFLSGRQRDIPLGLALVAVLFVLKVALLPQS